MFSWPLMITPNSQLLSSAHKRLETKSLVSMKFPMLSEESQTSFRWSISSTAWTASKGWSKTQSLSFVTLILKKWTWQQMRRTPMFPFKISRDMPEVSVMGWFNFTLWVFHIVTSSLRIFCCRMVRWKSVTSAHQSFWIRSLTRILLMLSADTTEHLNSSLLLLFMMRALICGLSEQSCLSLWVELPSFQEIPKDFKSWSRAAFLVSQLQKRCKS